MSQPVVPQQCFECPGKVFLLGEYAVLAGYPALIAAVGPRFRLTEGSDVTTEFVGESPVGKLLDQAKACSKFGFLDPHHEHGGFGASTAQFALLYLSLAAKDDRDRRWQAVWRRYRELTHASVGQSPSGADLVAQWRGGITYFNQENLDETLDVWPLMDWSNLLVFSASHQSGRKVPTHAHLADLAQRKNLFEPGSAFLRELGHAIEMGTDAVQNGDHSGFGMALSRYAEVLARYDLELPATREDRLALRSLSGVYGVKGSGAMQADALLVQLDPRNGNRAEIIAAAEARGLKLVSDGLPRQLGVSAGG